MKKIRLTATIIVSKLTIKLLRILKRGGTTLPGKIAVRLCPDILNAIAGNFKIIMVTGTNGKTTTTRIIAQMLKETGIEFITNKSGANLVSGIITTFIENVNLSGRSKYTTALLEIDEAAFRKISLSIEPDILVVTNFFRDQLDRFGELYTTLNNVKSGINNFKKTKLVLNADDSLCSSLACDTDKEVVYYGISSEAYNASDEIHNSDAVFCIHCKTKYEYSSRVYGHLGWFSCPNCGYSRPASQVTCTGIEELADTYSVINMDISGNAYKARINLPGLYNVYNSLAAAACGYLLNLSNDVIIDALGSFECGFGRMESIDAGGKSIKLILVKNPTGFDQVLSYLQTIKKPSVLAFIINDKLADGTDISWLWDVEFEKLSNMNNILSFFTSGIRAEDMAVRLKYASVNTELIVVEKDYDKLIEKALDKTPEGSNLYILPTYTAMLEIRKALSDKFALKEFWK